MKKVLAIIALGFALPCLAAPESKYVASVTADTNMVFGPRSGATLITFIGAYNDAAGQVEISARTGNRYAVTNAATTNVFLGSTNVGITNNDYIVYSAGNGAQTYAQVLVATANKLELSVTIGAANGTGDTLTEMSQQGVIFVGTSGVNVGGGAPVFASPVDSAVYINMNGGGNTNKLMATVGY